MSVINQAAKKSRTDVRKLTTMSMLAAIGVVLMLVCKFPIFPAASFLKYDPADVPILIGTLVYGPGAGLILTLVVSFMDSFVLSGSGGPIGFVMHVAATGAMVLLTGIIYKKGAVMGKKAASVVGSIAALALMAGINLVLSVTVPADNTAYLFIAFMGSNMIVLAACILYQRCSAENRFAAISLLMGSLVMVVVMVGMNLVLTPIYMGTPVEVVKGMLVPIIIPFNVLKAGLNSVAAFMVFRYVEKLAVR